MAQADARTDRALSGRKCWQGTTNVRLGSCQVSIPKMNQDTLLTVVAPLVCKCSLLNQASGMPQFVALIRRIFIRILQLEFVSFLERCVCHRNICKGLAESFVTAFSLTVLSSDAPIFLFESLITKQLV